MSNRGHTSAFEAGQQAQEQARETLTERRRLNAATYAWNYYGHRIPDLEQVVDSLTESGCNSFVWLAGDSSLDNKHWLFGRDKINPSVMFNDVFCAPAVNGYEAALEPPRMVKDVCYWLNKALAEEQEPDDVKSGRRICAVNTAVEESTLGQRVDVGEQALLPQDIFLRDHVTENDTIIVDVGGNDIALSPTVWTIINITALLFLSCTPVIKWCSFVFAPFSGCYVGFPLGMGYFVNMFRHKTAMYIEKLVEKRKPKRVIACMLYYLDESPSGGWADRVLNLLGYDRNPAKLQAVIRRVFQLGTSMIRVPGVEVVPFPLFCTLDGKDPEDYMERVEPSVQGGQKMAKALLPEILRPSPPSASSL
eukprot:CAMPEP_0115264428 /NCGR_PEP_ID=MMETSP0270-20121206/50424_1 /TAXON_ID=71861 /ORGANISM="Scrippsiella trochoidea, Strain CCMP3099" /LENGTH=363 /DNA_ID=CAMNT_0002680447 /DNA_START=61 /DNA_END=1152 /DNA_ORIENTATION=-